MHNIMDIFRQKVLIGDGAMGTLLQSKGMPSGTSPEVWMLSHPEKILEISTSYVKAGAFVVESNTFGANRLKLEEFGHGDSVHLVNATAVKLARQAAGPDRYVAGVIGPGGRFPSPVGDISFEELTEVFAQQAQSLSLCGADLILLQTFSDLGEARAAYLGVRKVTSLPVAVSLTYSHNQRTLTGTDPDTAAAVFSALGADMLGVNCSAGPPEILAVVNRYRKCCRLPLLAEPNAGIPVLENGRSVFPMTPEAMSNYVPLFLKSGVRWLGGCCGTDPAHIREMAAAAKDWDGELSPAPPEAPSTLASRTRTLYLGAHFPARLIGERLNPTARQSISRAIAAEDFSVFVREGADQLEAGADLLDVNAGLPGNDEAALLTGVVLHLQQSLDCPLVLDTVNLKALENALIHYQGKALVNSVNGGEHSLGTVLPLVKQYGAAVIGLTLDEKGIPDKAEGRLRVAEKILERAAAEGIAKENVFIDCLVMAAAADARAAAETLRSAALIKEKLGLTSVLGISNISHGMPERLWLNQAFLAQALAAGTDLVFANPLDPGVRHTMAAASFLAGKDPRGERYIEQTKKEAAKKSGASQNGCASAVSGSGSTSAGASPAEAASANVFPANTTSSDAASSDAASAGGSGSFSPEHTREFHFLQQAILQNDRKRIKKLLLPLSTEIPFAELVDQSIIPALNIAGDSFARGESFLPQLLLTAEGATFTFDLLRGVIPASAQRTLETVVLGTVAGDIHDIGKNIVKAILSSYGYSVVDLGKSVSASEFIRAVGEHKARVLGLSALMTTTMTEMEPVIAEIRRLYPAAKILVGGAVLTQAYAESIGADAYVKDASEAHGIIRRLLAGESASR